MEERFVTPEQGLKLLQHLEKVNEAPKSVDAFSDWYLVQNRPSGKLEWHAALRVSGQLGGGVAARLATPVDVWERDVYGHIELKLPFMPRVVRLNPVEWRPRRPHSNPPTAPKDLALITCFDRWHPFELNRQQDPLVFLQAAVGVAAPLPGGINGFSDYLHFCAIVWKCPDIEKVPPPPWSPSLV